MWGLPRAGGGACKDWGRLDPTLAAFTQRTPFRPFPVVLGSGTQFEVDHSGALIFRDGIAVFPGPGGVPVLCDHEGVDQCVADLADQPPS